MPTTPTFQSSRPYEYVTLYDGDRRDLAEVIKDGKTNWTYPGEPNDVITSVLIMGKQREWRPQKRRR